MDSLIDTAFERWYSRLLCSDAPPGSVRSAFLVGWDDEINRDTDFKRRWFHGLGRTAYSAGRAAAREAREVSV